MLTRTAAPTMARRALALLTVVICASCIPIRLTTYAYSKESSSFVGESRVSFELKPEQPAGIAPAPGRFRVHVSIYSDSLRQLEPALLRVRLLGETDSAITIIDEPARPLTIRRVVS